MSPRRLLSAARNEMNPVTSLTKLVFKAFQFRGTLSLYDIELAKECPDSASVFRTGKPSVIKFLICLSKMARGVYSVLNITE